MNKSAAAAQPAQKPAGRPDVRSREIVETDIPAIVELAIKAFPDRADRKFWTGVFAIAGRRAAPANYPRYGHALVVDDDIVGFLLLIYSVIHVDGGSYVRCNGSSLYIEPAYRLYASLLTSLPQKDKTVTIINTSPAPHTRPMVEASGYKKYTGGVFVCAPLLAKPENAKPVRVIDGRMTPDAPHEAWEADLMREHIDAGCEALWCVADGRAMPFVFRPMRLKGVAPAMHLIHAPSEDWFVHCARPIGLRLARRLAFFVLLDALGPIAGLPGAFRPDHSPRYYRGPVVPRVGDLAYSEKALFGI